VRLDVRVRGRARGLLRRARRGRRRHRGRAATPTASCASRPAGASPAVARPAVRPARGGPGCAIGGLAGALLLRDNGGGTSGGTPPRPSGPVHFTTAAAYDPFG